MRLVHSPNEPNSSISIVAFALNEFKKKEIDILFCKHPETYYLYLNASVDDVSSPIAIGTNSCLA